MKKLMFAVAAAFCGTVFGLESANIVGYTEYKTEAKKKPSFGACFMPLDGSASYKLKDLKPTNFDPDADGIQVINPTTLGADYIYVYMSKEIADAAAEEEGELPGAYDELVGWWDYMKGGVGEDGASANDVDVAAGAAFLGLFESGNNITFNFPAAL